MQIVIFRRWLDMQIHKLEKNRKTLAISIKVTKLKDHEQLRHRK